jgi:hypothetical protein
MSCIYTGCPTTYRTRQIFNNFTTNEDIAQQLGAHYRHIPLHFSPTNVLQFSSRCNSVIGFGIIKELPGLVGSGTSCIYGAPCKARNFNVVYIWRALVSTVKNLRVP